MFNRSLEEDEHFMGTSQQETIIAQGVKVEGDFTSQGDVVIDGEVTGSVHTEQSLRIGSSAKIHANVIAENAVIAGEVQGNLRVQDTLEVLASAKLQGDISTRVISVAPGATINGTIAMDGEGVIAQEEEEYEEEE